MKRISRNGIRVSAIAVVVSAAAFINASKNSNIRAVEILSLLACGISIGALLANLAISFGLKRKL
jgi:hypothetical protein